MAVRLPQGELPCDASVIAAGAFSRALAREAGSNTPLETERGYHVERLGASDGPTMPIMVADRKLIVTMTSRGPRVAGQVELAGLHAAPDWRRADVLKTLLHGLFPALRDSADAANTRYWMGHRPSSPDGKPYIGASRRSPDVILAYGHGHVGLGSSARTGQVVAQLLMGRKTEIDLKAFLPDRY
jgi:D-amino-acid dehydrogenase